MMKPILKSKTLTLGGQQITLYEMSALGNIEYHEYLAAHPLPQDSENLELEKALLDIFSRAIAHCLQPAYPESSIDELQTMVKTGCDPESISVMHKEVQALCGWNAQEQDADTEAEQQEPVTESEPSDPKI